MDTALFEQQGWQYLEMRIPPAALVAWDHFLACTHKSPQWNFPYDDGGEPELGFITKNQEYEEDGQKDAKIFFQYEPRLEEKIFAAHLVLTKEEQALIITSRMLYGYLRYNARMFFDALKKNPRYSGFPPWDNECHMLRFLAYTKTRSDSEGIIARAHKDRDFFTFALCESGPGLEVAPSREGPYRAISPDNPKLIVFSGTQCEEWLQPPIPGLWHRVRQIGAPHYPNCVRSSVVFFVKPHGVATAISTHT